MLSATFKHCQNFCTSELRIVWESTKCFSEICPAFLSLTCCIYYLFVVQYLYLLVSFDSQQGQAPLKGEATGIKTHIYVYVHVYVQTKCHSVQRSNLHQSNKWIQQKCWSLIYLPRTKRGYLQTPLRIRRYLPFNDLLILFNQLTYCKTRTSDPTF